MYKIKPRSTNQSDIIVDEETVLSFDDDELLNQFHLAVKAILDSRAVLKEKR